MTNTSYALRRLEMPTTAPVSTKDCDWDRAATAGTRMLIAEESFDAIVQMLIDAGLITKGCAAVMLDRLSAKLLLHASEMTETQWPIRQPELLDQARRLSTRAAAMRTSLLLSRSSC